MAMNVSIVLYHLVILVVYGSMVAACVWSSKSYGPFTFQKWQCTRIIPQESSWSIWCCISGEALWGILQIFINNSAIYPSTSFPFTFYAFPSLCRRTHPWREFLSSYLTYVHPINDFGASFNMFAVFPVY